MHYKNNVILEFSKSVELLAEGEDAAANIISRDRSLCCLLRNTDCYLGEWGREDAHTTCNRPKKTALLEHTVNLLSSEPMLLAKHELR